MAFARDQIHIDKPLTDFALSYMQDSSSFIADKVFPSLPVKKESDKYFIFDRTSWRQRDDVRSPRSASQETIMPKISNDRYSLEEHSLHAVVSQRELDNADSPLQPEQDAAAEVMEQLLINKEIKCASTAFTTTAVANSLSQPAASKWDYTSTTTPIKDMRLGIVTVAKEIGKDANTAIMGKGVFNRLQDHADFLDRIKYTQKGVVTEDLVASVLNLNSLQVGKACQVTSGDNLSETTAYIWGLNVLLSYVNPRPAIKGVCHGYGFTKVDGNAGLAADGSVAVMKWWEQKEKGYWIEGSIYYDFKVCSTLAGYLIIDSVSS